MKIYNFYSGSKGNCTYVTDGETSILIDAGGCLKRIRENLEELGDNLNNIKGIFITHEHSDHTKALFNLTKKYDCRIFTTLETARAICTPTYSVAMSDCRRVACSIMTVKTEKSYEIGSLIVKPFSTPHDAVSSVGFVVESTKDKTSLAYATDIGYISEDIAKNMLGVKNVIIEANHDIEMLKNGPYPEHLKIRILSEKGHLSNADCAYFIKKLVENGTKSILLAHLSEENNTPIEARRAVESELCGFDVALGVANPYSRVEMEIF